MTSLNRKQVAEGVLAHLRGVGPQTVAEIQDDLGLRKREVDDAIYYLMSLDRIEYAYPSTSPFSYVARAES